MNFEEFKAEYIHLFKEMMKYSPDEVGSLVFEERMAELADAYPEWAEQVEEEA